MDDISWPEAGIILGIIAMVIFLVGASMATYLDLRKARLDAEQEAQLRQLVSRYEQLAENTLDAQQRTAADVAELRSRAAAIEQILRTVE
jgi:flagellar basal body-associated protein FliL